MIKFYSENEVKADVKKLCDLKAKCGCGINYHTISVKGVKKYVINENKRIYSSKEIEKLYADFINEQKVIKRIIKKFPEIEIEYDSWDYLDNGNISGSYRNDNYVIDLNGYIIEIDLFVAENHKNDNSFNEEEVYSVDGLNIDIKNIKVIAEYGEIYLTDRSYKKLYDKIVMSILT